MIPFLYTLPNALSAEQCNSFIDAFEQSKFQKHGTSRTPGSNELYNYDVKKSTDIGFHLTNGCDSLTFESNLWLDKIYDLFTDTCINKGIKEYTKLYPEIDGYPRFSIHTFNMQRYLPGEGFYKWHFENGIFNNRYLVWMIYLNDVEDGGTEFKYQNHIEHAEQGKLIIWPADFTFTHRGQISQTKTKYILTGWFEKDNI